MSGTEQHNLRNLENRRDLNTSSNNPTLRIDRIQPNQTETGSQIVNRRQRELMSQPNSTIDSTAALLAASNELRITDLSKWLEFMQERSQQLSYLSDLSDLSNTIPYRIISDNSSFSTSTNDILDSQLINQIDFTGQLLDSTYGTDSNVIASSSSVLTNEMSQNFQLYDTSSITSWQQQPEMSYYTNTTSVDLFTPNTLQPQHNSNENFLPTSDSYTDLNFNTPNLRAFVGRKKQALTRMINSTLEDLEMYGTDTFKEAYNDLKGFKGFLDLFSEAITNNKTDCWRHWDNLQNAQKSITSEAKFGCDSVIAELEDFMRNSKNVT
jgi:hypothetical protein